MRFPKTSLAVALIAATLGMPAVAAPDMHHDQGPAAPAMHDNGMRHDNGMHHGWRHHDNWGHHNGWRHHGWRSHCWTRWHHHHAVRVCR
jgi:hypothetical protein